MACLGCLVYHHFLAKYECICMNCTHSGGKKKQNPNLFLHLMIKANMQILFTGFSITNALLVVCAVQECVL